MEDKEKQIIKDLYKDLIEVQKLNHPDYYMMPKTFYDGMIKKILHTEDYLKIARRSASSWRERAEKAEKQLKSQTMEITQSEVREC